MNYKQVVLKHPGKSFRGPVPHQYLGQVVNTFDAEKDGLTIVDAGTDILVHALKTNEWLAFPNADVDYKIPIMKEPIDAAQKGK